MAGPCIDTLCHSSISCLRLFSFHHSHGRCLAANKRRILGLLCAIPFQIRRIFLAWLRLIRIEWVRLWWIPWTGDWSPGILAGGFAIARIHARNCAWFSSEVPILRKTGSAMFFRSFVATLVQHEVSSILPSWRRNSLRFASPSLSPGRISSTWSNWLSLTHSVPHLVSPRSIRVSFQSNVDSNPSEPESFPFQPGRERKPKWEKGVEASIRIRVLRFATHACFGPQRGSCATKRRGKERHACVFARDLACGSTRPPHATEPEDGGGVVRRTSLGCGFQGGCKLPIASEWNHCL